MEQSNEKCIFFLTLLAAARIVEIDLQQRDEKEERLITYHWLTKPAHPSTSHFQIATSPHILPVVPHVRCVPFLAPAALAALNCGSVTFGPEILY